MLSCLSMKMELIQQQNFTQPKACFCLLQVIPQPMWHGIVYRGRGRREGVGEGGGEGGKGGVGGRGSGRRGEGESGRREWGGEGGEGRERSTGREGGRLVHPTLLFNYLHCGII